MAGQARATQAQALHATLGLSPLSLINFSLFHAAHINFAFSYQKKHNNGCSLVNANFYSYRGVNWTSIVGIEHRPREH